MIYRKLLPCALAAVLALALACSKGTPSPTSPTAAQPGAADAAPDGSTLKVSAPAPQSPVNGQQPDNVLLVTNRSTAEFANTPDLSYEFEIYNSANQRVYRGVQAGGSGSTVSHAVNAQLEFEQNHTWRVRAFFGSGVGPWSSAAAFRTPAGSYIANQEIRDVLTNGTTVGQRNGSIEFRGAEGVRLNTMTSYINYQLPQALEEGEFSFLATNVDEGNVCDKCKVMVMAEGCHADVTDNDYRMSLEVRGSLYPVPGQISFRVITGDTENHRDIPRASLSWNRTETYFFKMWWRTGVAGYEIRTGSATGPIKHEASTGTDGHPYRPSPHCVYLGSGPARGGFQDQTHQGMTVKHVWVSGRARPNFPSIGPTQPE